MRFHTPKNQAASFQLAPMIDIVFLLLIFFIVEWKYTRDETEIEISVPTAEKGTPAIQSISEIFINVTKTGQVRVSKETLTHEQLRAKLAHIVRVHKNQPVRIRGDQATPYQMIVQVIDTCRKAGIWNISFATQSPKKP